MSESGDVEYVEPVVDTSKFAGGVTVTALVGVRFRAVAVNVVGADGPAPCVYVIPDSDVGNTPRVGELVSVV